MKKKVLSILLTALMAISFVSCGGNNAGEDTSGDNNTQVENDSDDEEAAKEKITIWAWDPNFNIAIMNEAKGVYEKDNPNIEIEIVDFAKADLEQKLNTILASGSTDELPEIVLMEDYNGQKYLQSYPGAFADLTGKIPHDKFAQYKIDFMKVDDSIYGIPFDSGVAGWYYRKDILEEAGFTAEDLQNITWDRFLEIGKVVLEKTGTPLLSVEPNDLALIRMMINTNGTWYFDDKGDPYFTENEDIKKAIEIFVELINSGVASLHAGWAEFVGNFNAGNVASVPTGIWITASVMQEESQKGLWAIAPMPRLNDTGSVNAANLGGSSWYVLENSKKKDTAISFMNEMYTNEDFYNSILANNGAVGTYLPSMNGEAYSQEIEYFGGQAIYKDFSKWMADIPGVNVGMYTYEAEDILAAEIIAIMDGKSIDDAMESVQAQVEMQMQ